MLSIARACRLLSGLRLPFAFHDLLHGRRAWQLAVLALALLVVQSGAQLHAVSHLGDLPAATGVLSAAAGDEGDGDHLLTYCADCLALAALDLPLGERAPRLPAPASAACAAAVASVPPPGTAALPPRCRAPPPPPAFLATV